MIQLQKAFILLSQISRLITEIRAFDKKQECMYGLTKYKGSLMRNVTYIVMSSKANYPQE